MPPATTTRRQYLERDPPSSYKQLSIKGRRIKARTLYGQHVNAEHPRTVEELAGEPADLGRPLAGRKRPAGAAGVHLVRRRTGRTGPASSAAAVAAGGPGAGRRTLQP